MTLQADSAAAAPPLPPPDSAATNGISPTAEETSQPPRPTPPPELRVPIWWPEDGTLSMDWVENLMRCFDWCSRNVPPSELPSVLPVEVFDSLILVASKMLHKEPNCVPVDPFRPTLDDNSTPSDSAAAASVVVVGDVHGQLHDLLFLLRDAGFPSRDRIFVFNGDYVDRGAWGLETFLLLLAWKFKWSNVLYFVLEFVECLEVFMPHNIYLLRGNHESKYCTSVYGFEKEVMVKYGDKGKHVYRKCLGCFEGLPLASIIAGCVYTAHGGLFRSVTVMPSKRLKGKKNRKINVNHESKILSLGSLEELCKARRSVLDPPWEGPNLIPGDVLWSDPSKNPGLAPNKERGIGLMWGPDCTEEFLKKYQLKSMDLLRFRLDGNYENRQQNLFISNMGNFSQNTWSWDFRWRRNLFDYENEQAIAFMEDISAFSIQQQLQDIMVWKAEPNGLYSTKSAYRLLMPTNSPGQHSRNFQILMKLKIPPRADMFSWRLFRDRLPTRANLLRRNVVLQQTMCPLCGNHQEEAGHLFFHCRMTIGLWWEFMSWTRFKGAFSTDPATHFIQFCEGFGTRRNHNRRCIWWIALTSTIWQHRNSLLFKGTPFEPPKVLDDALFHAWSWLKVSEKVPLLIIRSHEGPDAREKRDGFEGMDEGYTIDHVVDSGKLVTVFSAPDYPQFQLMLALLVLVLQLVSFRMPRNAPGNTSGVAWKPGISVEETRKIQCKYCPKVVKGGAYELKHHLFQTSKGVEACKAVIDDVRKEVWDIV
ncbi:Serine/threonine-protein phosphatase 7 [Glycine soja]